MMVDLKPCPFCGGEAFAGATLDHVCYVMCRSETCWSMVGYLPTKAEAIEAWNRRALSPAGTASEMEPVGWQPIETAPKDGTTILMGKFHDGDFYWMASGRIEDGQFWCDFPDEFFVPFSHQNPTHWMPLPAPPKAGE